MSITQKELADKLNISTATVSRALAGSEKISVETRRRVLQAARQSGYNSRSSTVAVLIPELHLTGYFGEAATALFRELEQSGFRPLLLSARHLDLLEELDICGAISVLALNGLERSWGKNHILPLVCINTAPNHLEGIYTVSSNDEQAMRIAIRHLYSLGHRKIGRLAFYGSLMREDNWNSVARGRCFKEELENLGLCPDFSSYISDTNSCIEAMQELSEQGVSAVILQDEELELTVLQALRIMKYKIPDDISLVAWSFAGVGERVHPMLTTLVQDLPQLARKSCEILRALLNGENVIGDVFVDYQFYPRSSTGACRR